MPRIARRFSVTMVWTFLGACGIFMFFPGLVPTAMDPDPARGLTALLHVNGSRGMPSYNCYTWPWATEVYKSLRIAILVGAAPFMAALFFLHRTKAPKA